MLVLSLQKLPLILKLLKVCCERKSEELLSEEEEEGVAGVHAAMCKERRVSGVYLTVWQSGPLASCEPCGGMEAAGC